MNNAAAQQQSVQQAMNLWRQNAPAGNQVQPWPPLGGGGWGPPVRPLMGWDVQPWPPFGGTPAGFAAGAVHPLVQALANSLQSVW